ncbi:CDP-diacylglycerol diphosphatase [Acetobacter pasteurianus]
MATYPLFTVRRFSILFMLVLVLWGTAAFGGENPDVLWHIVHEQCAVGSFSPMPVACEETNTRAGYAVLKDRTGPAQYLLIPTQRVTGMEDPAIVKNDAPDYFGYAWQQVMRVNRHLAHALPMDDLSLAINSAYGRTQNQLHIHVDCIRPDVKVALHWALPQIDTHWHPLLLDGHRYRARLLPVGQLSGVYPFRILAKDMSNPTDEMGQHTLVIVGITQLSGHPGFVLLDDQVDIQSKDYASGEELQDHSCKIQNFP